jgi:hypothetical protein
MTNETKFKLVFSSELLEIIDTAILDFVLLCVRLSCPSYFWTIPSSQTGKHHPPISQGTGGQVRHTKLAYWWARELMQVCEITPTQQDEIRAAVLLHDMLKLGPNSESPPDKYQHIHGMLFVMDVMSKLSKEDKLTGSQSSILDAIAKHMGRWTEPYIPCQESWVAHVVHLADYVASCNTESIKLDYKADEYKVCIPTFLPRSPRKAADDV